MDRHNTRIGAIALGLLLLGLGMSPNTGAAQSGETPTLAERLGYGPGDKLLIVNGDDVGMSHAANAASIEAMENGLMTSATIMVPCPWFPEIAAYGMGPLRAQLAADGIVSPDYLVFGGPDDGEPVEAYWKRILRTLKPGVTELFIHAAAAGEEMRHITNSWTTRDTEFRLFTTDPEIRNILQEENITLIGYRALRDLQRAR